MPKVSSDEIKEFLASSVKRFRFNGVASECDHCEPLHSASAGSIAWASQRSSKEIPLKSSVMIVSEDAEISSDTVAIFYVPSPRLAFARIVKAFFQSQDNSLISGGEVHPDSKCHETLRIGRGSHVASDCIIGKNVVIESNVTIHPGTRIGDSVYIQSGVVIGSSGFGFIENEEGGWEHFPHIGGVVLENGVEVGANSCIDRGTLSDTRIGKGTKVSNLCQIAHNVEIGSNCLIAGKAQIGGGSVVGNDSYIGPSAIISNKIKIASGSDVKIGSVVIADVEGVVSGNFAMPHKRNLMNYMRNRRGK